MNSTFTCPGCESSHEAWGDERSRSWDHTDASPRRPRPKRIEHKCTDCGLVYVINPLPVAVVLEAR